MKWRRVGLIVVGLIILTLFGMGFYYTGGRGLLRIIPNYLMADIPDKRYGWGDFVPSSDTQRVSGFYSPQLSGDNAVAIWTLAGLKRFYHKSGTSVYYYRDVCAQVKSLIVGEDGQPKPIPSREVAYFDTQSWQQYMRAEYPVTVLWTEIDGQRVVDKLWSVSGRYKVMGLVGGDVCE